MPRRRITRVHHVIICVRMSGAPSWRLQIGAINGLNLACMRLIPYNPKDFVCPVIPQGSRSCFQRHSGENLVQEAVER